ncbi:class I SAM-dependent methyltransferase [Patescibacteria group bacterium]
MNKCIICKSSKFKVLYKSKDWQIEKCLKCGLVRTKRQKKESLSDYHRDEQYLVSEKQFVNIFKKRIEIINKLFIKKGRVVDIGCSTGIFLNLLKDEGWEVLGIEPSRSAKYAKQKGLEVINKTFEETKLPNNKYDLVVLNHTLEHLNNPLQVLKKVYSILKKGGIVFVDVPNFGSISSVIFRKRYKFLLPKEHNYHFTKDSLEKLLKESNFKIKYSETRSGIFDYNNPFLEIWMSLISFKKRFFTNIVNLPLSFIEKIFNRGTAITIIGQK